MQSPANAAAIAASIVMVSGTGPREPMPAFLYVYVDDTDETYRRALALVKFQSNLRNTLYNAQ